LAAFARVTLSARVARCHILKPKIPFWVNLGGSFKRRCRFILWPFGQFSGHLVYFMAIWYIFMVIWFILWPFGIFLWPFSLFYGHLVYFVSIWCI
jgi:hypothetical protein